MLNIENINSLSNPNKQFVSTFGDKFEKIYKNPLDFSFLVDNKEIKVKDLILNYDKELTEAKTKINNQEIIIKELKSALQSYINNEKEVDNLLSSSIDLLNTQYSTLILRMEKAEDKIKFI